MSRPDQSINPRILKSAKGEFLAQGFQNASLKTICQEARVTTGALYKRYSSKEALFAAVVESTVADLNAVCMQKYMTDFSLIPDGALIRAWDVAEGSMLWWFRYLQERRDGFVLLINCAENTRYANFRHDWVEKLTEANYAYYQEAYRRGLTEAQLTKTAMHILLSSFWTALYEPFIHGYSFQEMEEHCHLVCRFFNWNHIFCFKRRET